MTDSHWFPTAARYNNTQLEGLPCCKGMPLTGFACSERSLLQSSQLQSQTPPCITRQSGWYQCTADGGQSPGALCLPLCMGDKAQGPCQPCSDANKACNTVRPRLLHPTVLQRLTSAHPTCEVCPTSLHAATPCMLLEIPTIAPVLHEPVHTDPSQAWSSYNGKLQASLSFNSTDICPQLASKMTEGACLHQAHTQSLPA